MSNATVVVPTKFVIRRTHLRDGSECPPNLQYWMFEDRGATFSEGWVGPEEASLYSFYAEAQAQIMMRQLSDHGHPTVGPQIIEVIDGDSGWQQGKWYPVDHAEREAARLENLDVSENKILIPAKHFTRLLAGLLAKEDNMPCEYSYQIDAGLVSHYKNFRTLQPNRYGGTIAAFQFHDDFDCVFVRDDLATW